MILVAVSEKDFKYELTTYLADVIATYAHELGHFPTPECLYDHFVPVIFKAQLSYKEVMHCVGAAQMAASTVQLSLFG